MVETAKPAGAINVFNPMQQLPVEKKLFRWKCETGEELDRTGFTLWSTGQARSEYAVIGRKYEGRPAFRWAIGTGCNQSPLPPTNPDLGPDRSCEILVEANSSGAIPNFDQTCKNQSIGLNMAASVQVPDQLYGSCFNDKLPAGGMRLATVDGLNGQNPQAWFSDRVDGNPTAYLPYPQSQSMVETGPDFWALLLFAPPNANYLALVKKKTITPIDQFMLEKSTDGHILAYDKNNQTLFAALSTGGTITSFKINNSKLERQGSFSTNTNISLLSFANDRLTVINANSCGVYDINGKKFADFPFNGTAHGVSSIISPSGKKVAFLIENPNGMGFSFGLIDLNDNANPRFSQIQVNSSQIRSLNENPNDPALHPDYVLQAQYPNETRYPINSFIFIDEDTVSLTNQLDNSISLVFTLSQPLATLDRVVLHDSGCYTRTQNGNNCRIARPKPVGDGGARSGCQAFKSAEIFIAGQLYHLSDSGKVTTNR